MQFPVHDGDPVVALAAGVTFLVLFGGIPAISYWAARDAAARDGSAVWTLAYLLTGFGVLHYAYVRFVRGDLGGRDAPPARRERLAAAYAMAITLAFLAGAVVSPPDPVTQIFYFLPLFVVAFAGMVLLVTRGPLASESETAA